MVHWLITHFNCIAYPKCALQRCFVRIGIWRNMLLFICILDFSNLILISFLFLIASWSSCYFHEELFPCLMQFCLSFFVDTYNFYHYQANYCWDHQVNSENIVEYSLIICLIKTVHVIWKNLKRKINLLDMYQRQYFSLFCNFIFTLWLSIISSYLNNRNAMD